MATLVLSAVGSALGGPVGGAIGAIIGQSFDRQLLAPPTRGPRLGDLSVQSSSYGTQIPRIYGSMRVAGAVIWATDLVEGEQTTGAKGQPDVVYSYSVSLAVALSSRPVGAIGRIWADGKLLRGAEGDFKVPTTFRFYDGGEAQDIDPLIASVEGIANTPAYRGLAMAVFENLELAAFGNRIPFMTFEVIADPGAPALSAILGDASAGAITSDASETIIGYAAYGGSIAAAVQPLVDCFDLRLFDDGSTLRPAVNNSAVTLRSDELGNSADGQAAPTLEREQLPARSVPSTLKLAYYDPSRDYQTGEARASAGEPGNNEAQQELPAVLSADGAKTLVQQMLARQWSARDKLTLRLPPARVGLEPGAIVEPGVAPSTWLVEKCSIDGFVTIVELRLAWHPVTALLGEAGRIVANSDVVQAPLTLALIETPSAADQGSDATVLIAASSPSRGWGVRPLSVSSSGQSFSTRTAARKSLLGRTITILGDAAPYLVDEINSVDVELVDQTQWIASCDDDALADGSNLAVLGREIIQFGEVTGLGQGRFRLSRLLRGRAGSEWATAAHIIGETFCLLDGNSLQSLAIPVWLRGATLTAADREGSSAMKTFGAESITPLQPCRLTAVDHGGGLTLTWTRRSRSGLAWLDEVDAPLGESQESYRVTIIGTAGSLELITAQPIVDVPAADLAGVGSGLASIEVRQLGDWAASRPAQLTFNIS